MVYSRNNVCYDCLGKTNERVFIKNMEHLLLYIDPGTGSMLFTIIIGLVGVGVFFLRSLAMKLKFIFTGGRKTGKDPSQTEIAVFSDNKRYWKIFEPVFDELEKRGQSALYLTASPDDPGLSKEYEHIKCTFIGEGNRAFARLNFIKADIVLSTTPGLDVYQWKRSKSAKYYVHLPHAASDLTIYRMFGIDFYDAILLSGQYQADQIRALEKVRGIPEKELKLVGIPYMDEMKKRRDEALKNVEKTEKKTVLLAPSWGTSSILNRFGADFIRKLRDTGYKIIVRPHPQSFITEKEMLEPLMEEFSDLEWNSDNDNFDVLMRSDILISDFSGVIFDYTLIYDKPVIYTDTEFDKAPYDASWLDEELWTFEVLPKLGKKLTADNMDSLKGMIDELTESDAYAQGREEARKQTWEHRGEGAVRVADYLIAKLKELEEKKS